MKITLDDAIQMALQHNHTLLADAHHDPAEPGPGNYREPAAEPCAARATRNSCRFFNPNQFNSDYLDNAAQFDLGLSYLFERGKKRQHRLQAAKDADGRDELAGGR